MSYAHTEKFVKPIRFNDSQHTRQDQQQSLDNFRYERNQSLMAEIVRKYLKMEATK